MRHATPITRCRQIVPQTAATSSLQTKLDFIVDLWTSIGATVLNLKLYR